MNKREKIGKYEKKEITICFSFEERVVFGHYKTRTFLGPSTSLLAN